MNLFDLVLEGDLAPMLLVCPSAEPSSMALSGSVIKGHGFDPATISYRLHPQILRGGFEWLGAHRAFARCPIHGSSLLTSVTSGVVASDTSNYVRWPAR